MLPDSFYLYLKSILLEYQKIWFFPIAEGNVAPQGLFGARPSAGAQK